MNDERDMKQVVISTVGVAMLVSSCSAGPTSSGARPEAPTTTSSSTVTLDTLPPPSPDPADVEWATSVIDVVNAMQLARTEAIFHFNERLASITRTYDVLLERFEAEAVAVDLAVDSLPPAPTETAEAFAPYVDLVTATAALSQATDEALAELREREPELRTDDREKLSPALQQMIDQHAVSVAAWQSACFAVQNALVELVAAVVDCVGIAPAVAPSDDGGDDTTATTTPTPTEAGGSDVETAADVEADLECVRGASSDDLQFDTTPYDFLTPARGRWIMSRLTIENNSAERVQLDARLRVRWYDEDGETLATTFWPEPYKPALTARAGQTIVRTGLGFEDVRGLGGEELSPELLDLVFGESAGCELLAPLTFTAIDDDAFLAPDFADRVEITECRRDDEAGRWLIGFRVTNPTDRPLTVSMTAELVDVDGNRLGMGGGTPMAVDPGTTVDAETPGYSVLYTIDQPDRVDRCELFAVEME